jgi:hypothetical protein
MGHRETTPRPDVGNTQVSDAGVNELKKALPNVNFDR